MKIENLTQFKQVGLELKALISKSQSQKLSEIEYKRMVELQRADDDYCAGAEYTLGC